MNTSNKLSSALFVLSLVLLFVLGYGYYINYMDVAPNHPNSPYVSLFPGMNIDMANGPDIGQMMSMSMVFVVKNTNGQFGNAEPYGLTTISRMGCSNYSGYALSAAQPIDLAQYEGKAILVREYMMSGENEMVLQRVDLDQYVNDHMSEYRAAGACSTPFNSFGL